jgi:hypothetical protein
VRTISRLGGGGGKFICGALGLHNTQYGSFWRGMRADELTCAARPSRASEYAWPLRTLGRCARTHLPSPRPHYCSAHLARKLLLLKLQRLLDLKHLAALFKQARRGCHVVHRQVAVESPACVGNTKAAGTGAHIFGEGRCSWPRGARVAEASDCYAVRVPALGGEASHCRERPTKQQHRAWRGAEQRGTTRASATTPYLLVSVSPRPAVMASKTLLLAEASASRPSFDILLTGRPGTRNGLVDSDQICSSKY